MTATLLQQLRNQGICIYSEAGKLKTKSRKNAMTAELAQQIRGNKDALQTLLDQLQPAQVSTDSVDAELAYWKAQWQGAPTQHQLPRTITTNHTHSAQTTAAHAVTVALDISSAQLSNWVNAALVAWLARMGHQDDIVLARSVRVANASQAGLSESEPCGFQVLPQRVAVDAEQPFEDLLAQLSAQNSTDEQHAVMGFATLKDLLGEPDTQTNICQILCAVNTPSATWEALATFDLVVSVTSPNQLTLMSTTGAFTQPQLAQFADTLSTLMISAQQQPQTRLDSLNMLSASAREQVLAIHQAKQQFPVTQGIHQRVAAQAEQFPEHIAVRCGDTQLTYAELLQQANKVAQYLVAQGVQPNTLVGLCVERSVNTLVGILGILSAGAAYLPMDSAYPEERLLYLLEDSGVTLVLTDNSTHRASYLAAVTTANLEQVVLDEHLATVPPPQAESSEFSPDQLAYVIYTSGSTGNPKGVQIGHQQVMRLMAAAAQHFTFTPADRWTVFHSFSFDFTVWEMWGALFYGGTAVVVERHVARFPEDFYRLVADEQITVLSQTPSAFEQFSRVDATQQQPLALRYVVFGGEALNVPSLQSWQQRHGDTTPELINMYGITETTVHVTYRRIVAADIDAGNGSFIGQPLADLSAYVLDAQLNPVPFGVVGELFVGGAGVARGYLNREALNKERFIACKQTQIGHLGAHGEDHSEDDARLYRTGDLVRCFENGDMAYMGRIDHQVKLRGFRIELGEIEAQLAATPWVENACVIIHGNRADEQRLVAYVTPVSGAEHTVQGQALNTALREALLANLPDFMVPSAFMLLDAFPLTVNGKIDKKQLPEPIFGETQQEYVAPTTEQEQQVADIWAEILRVEKVGVTDNFFALGGDSMRAIPLVARLKAVGVNAGIRDLYQAPSIQQLLARSTESTPQSLPDIPAFSLLSDAEKAWVDSQFAEGELDDAYPMTALQQGMVAQNLLQSEQGTYHDLLGYHLTVAWDRAKFEQALHAVVSRHDTLRTVFSMTSEHALQLVKRDSQAVVIEHDIRHVPAEAQEQAIQAWINTEKTQTFDCAERLWQLVIHRRSDTSFQYTLDMHHALLDGWSVATFNSQLFAAYLDLLEGKDPQHNTVFAAAATALPYKYNVYFELQALQDAAITRYWQDRFADVQLPWWTGKPKQAVHRRSFYVSRESAVSIQRLARQWQVTDKSVILASYFVLLSMLTGKKDVTTSVVMNSRPEFDGGEQTLGLFLNSLPMRVDTRDLTWMQLAKAVHEQTEHLQRVKHYPLAAVARDVAADFSASIFNYVELHAYEQIDTRIQVESGTAFDEKDYLFGVEIFKAPQAANAEGQSLDYGFEVRFEVDQFIFPTPFLTRIEGYYQQIIESLVSEKLGVLRQMDFMPEQEINTLLNAWNNTAVDHGTVPCIHTLIEQQVTKTPENIAAVFAGDFSADSRMAGDETAQDRELITYAALNRRANQLAHWLRAQGVKPDTAVGLCMQRSIDMVVGILGILKAGGAYVPLEPTLPAERLSYMIQDAELTLIVGQEATLPAVAHEHTDAAHHIAIDNADVMALLSAQASDNLDPVALGVNEMHLAYIFYTSGSTGNPKGVMCTHRGMANRMQWGQRHYGFTPADRFLQKTPFMFDISICEFMAPLICGARIVLPKPEGHKDPAYLLDVMIREQVTMAHFVPSLLTAFLNSVDISRCDSLRLVVNGGEEMSKELNDKFFATGTHAEYHNLYGPTEAAIETSYWYCDAASPLPFVPIGKPMDNTQLYVLNDAMEVQPIGVEGELHIGGAGLARGYLNLPAVTAEKFIENPHTHRLHNSANGSDRLYKTGDLARFMEDGNVQYLGRLDDQVKINGLRIELGEIKSRLLQVASVKECVVMAQRETTGARIIAYVVPHVAVNKEQASDYVAQVKAALREHLPLYMVPAVITVLDSFPLLTNGKINKRALPAPDAQAGVAYVAPSTETEQQLAQLWQTLLNLSQPVSANAGFFELGGQSLLAIRLINDIRERFNVIVPFAQLFEHQVLNELGALIDEQQLRQHTTFDADDALADDETELLL